MTKVAQWQVCYRADIHSKANQHALSPPFISPIQTNDYTPLDFHILRGGYC